MVDWIKDDGTFTDDWMDKANIPAEQREYAKGAKDVATLIKRGADTQREFHSRVKLPADEAGKRAFIKEHFQPLLDADATTAEKKRDADAAAAKVAAEADAKKAREEGLTKLRERVKSLLGGPEGKLFDTNLELGRRALRSDQFSQTFKDAFAASVGAESFAKVTDEQIREALGSDPIIAEAALLVGKLSQDGKLESDDGRHHTTTDEKEPLQPNSPELYMGLPAGDPIRKWWENQGYDMSGSVPRKKSA